MPRGGPRQGIAGKKYGNRTDLALGPRKLPVTTAPDQPYGEAGQQRQSQQQVPMASGPLPTPGLQDVATSVQNYTPPPVIPMGAPTMNPGEHVMTGQGQPVGAAGAPPVQADPVLKGAALLNALGDNASPAVKALRAVLSAHQANQAAP